MREIVSGICGKCRKYYKGAWCPSCEKIDAERTLNFIADFHDDYYDSGLGEVVKSRQHRKQLMKEKKLEEVGNEWKYVDPAKHRERSDQSFHKRLNQAGEEYIHKWR
jgi:uncharacterized protein (DUF2164 family)